MMRKEVRSEHEDSLDENGNPKLRAQRVTRSNGRTRSESRSPRVERQRLGPAPGPGPEQRLKQDSYDCDELDEQESDHKSLYDSSSRDSTNPDDNSTSSKERQPPFCLHYTKYINPYKFFAKFSHDRDEGNQELTTGSDQRNLFCVVMIIKCIQLLSIAGFLALIPYFEPLQRFLTTYHRYWVAVPFGLVTIIVIVARMWPLFRRLKSYYHIALLFVVTGCYAYIMGSLSAHNNSLIITKVLWLLPSTVLFIGLFAAVMNISVVKRMIYISAVSSVIFFATAMAFLPPVYELNSGFELSVDIWLPAVIASEILIFVTVK